MWSELRDFHGSRAEAPSHLLLLLVLCLLFTATGCLQEGTVTLEDTTPATDSATGGDGASAAADTASELGSESELATPSATDTESASAGDACADVDDFDPASCAAPAPAAQGVLYVRGDAPPGGDGASWATAYDDVQAAIDAAHCAFLQTDAPCQVWVAASTYNIFRECPTDTIRLRPGVEVYGGFAGNETGLEQRDLAANETILDGHDEGGLQQVYNVVRGADDARLDGFAITGGNAVGSTVAYGMSGAGLLAIWSSPTVSRCHFYGNGASMATSIVALVGAIWAENSSIRIVDCTFTDNGPAAVVLRGGAPTIERSVFRANTGTYGGGIYVNTPMTLEIRSCWFESNYSLEDGAAILNDGDADVRVENSIFINNEASGAGGAILNWGSMTIKNSVFFGNTAGFAGSVLASAYVSSETSVENSILWNNGANPIFDVYDAATTVTHSDIQGGFPGEGNLDADPLFVDAENGDFHLQAGSPCIDQGEPQRATTDDYDGQSRDSAPDMGAFEHVPAN